MPKLIVALPKFAKAPNNKDNIKINTKYLLVILLCNIWKYLGLQRYFILFFLKLFKISSNVNFQIPSLPPVFVVFV
jgi:hypothetical protein